jgi:hypothetical protein
MPSLPPNNNTGLNLDLFIAYATQHLGTVGGKINTTSLFPPNGTPGPAIIPWLGYFVEPAKQTISLDMPGIVTPELLATFAEQNQLMDAIGYPIGEANPYTIDEISTDFLLDAKSENFESADLTNVSFDVDSTEFLKILDETPQSSISIPGNNDVDTESDSYKNALDKLRKNNGPAGTLDWFKLAAQVIRVCEGGYYHPDMQLRNPKGFAGMGKSGETMMGIDRTFDDKKALASPEGVAFWKLIDTADARHNWKYEYIPPGPLFNKLATYVAAMQKPQWDAWFPSSLGYRGYPDLQKVILSNDLLFFNHIYCVWNGSGWFKGFADIMKAAWNSGIKDGNKLALLFLKRRIANKGVIDNVLYTPISQGGERICQHYGINPRSLA